MSEYKQSNLTEWKVDYAYIMGGVAHEVTDFCWEYSFCNAVKEMEERIQAEAEENGWEKWMIWNVGIVKEELFD